jgi:hypothetical protein
VKRRFWIGCRAQSTIEFAFTLPLLLLLALGVFEFGRAIQAKNIITNMSREGTNLVSRPTGSATPQDIMGALANTAQPLDMPSYGMMYISKLRGLSDGSGRIEVVKQYRWPTNRSVPSSNVAACGSGGNGSWINGTCTPSSMLEANYSVIHLSRGDLANGQVAYATEVSYRYQAVFNRVINYSPQIYSITVF